MTAFADLSFDRKLTKLAAPKLTVRVADEVMFRVVGNSFAREVCEHASAHSLPDKVEAAYRCGNLIEKRKVLMQVWADYCASAPSDASVARLRRVD